MPARTINKPLIYLYWLPVLGCMGFVFYASSVSGANIPPIFAFQEIVYHFFIYLILGFLFVRAFRKTYPDIIPAKAVLITVVFGIIYGLSDEWHQGFVSYRSVSGFDVLIDTIGSIVGSLIYR